MMAPGPFELLIISAILLALIGIPITVVIALFLVSRSKNTQSQSSQSQSTQGDEYHDPPVESK